MKSNQVAGQQKLRQKVKRRNGSESQRQDVNRYLKWTTRDPFEIPGAPTGETSEGRSGGYRNIASASENSSADPATVIFTTSPLIVFPRRCILLSSTLPRFFSRSAAYLIWDLLATLGALVFLKDLLLLWVWGQLVEMRAIKKLANYYHSGI